VELISKSKFKFTIAFLIAIVILAVLVMGFDQNQSSAQSNPEKELDYGLVWYGRDGNSRMVVADQPNRYFDPNKPTIIFIHGWMPDQAGDPPTFMVEFEDQLGDNSYTLDVARAWVEAGWNIGIFYWHPFSDEELVWVAEDKIWTPNAEAGMRFRDANGNYHTEGAPSVSVSELLLQAYLDAMKNFSGAEIRIAGHSLGNQLAVNLTADLVKEAEAGDISKKLIPSRLALLDPFWSPFPKTYLDGLETGEFIQQKIEQIILPQDILVEWYHSSWLTESTMIREDIPKLKIQVVYAELDPAYCGLLNQICKHDGAWHLYFLSYGSPAVPECIWQDASEYCEPSGENGPMASTSNSRMAEMMKLPNYWVHAVGPDGIDGRLTPQTDDDWFHRFYENDEME
jgi:uncharacterized protein YjdB